MFIDKAKIFVKSGDGGRGCVSFRREAHVPRGGPNGGDGGAGGDVIMEVDKNMSTLLDFKYNRHYKGKNGAHGQGSKKDGKSGAHCVIKIPPGTMVRNLDTGELIADFAGEVERLVIAQGGRGGYGNSHFANPSNKVPQYAQPGEEGIELNLELELKLIADAGLVGFPNAGKSTLISKLSAAKPKIADYPFTTLAPNLGVVKVEAGKNFVLADIPGLIEGAHQGKGLGLEFLRHVQRTKVLIYLLDISNHNDSWEEYQTLKKELEEYDVNLIHKPYIIVFNKIDMLESEFELDEKWEKDKCYFISALTGKEVNKLRYIIYSLLN